MKKIILAASLLVSLQAQAGDNAYASTQDVLADSKGKLVSVYLKDSVSFFGNLLPHDGGMYEIKLRNQTGSAFFHADDVRAVERLRPVRYEKPDF